MIRTLNFQVIRKLLNFTNWDFLYLIANVVCAKIWLLSTGFYLNRGLDRIDVI